jgi:predicted RNase H-like HicB family nuclease
MIWKFEFEAGKLTMRGYAIIVSDEDDAWVADVPDLKSCAAFEASPEEAVAV